MTTVGSRPLLNRQLLFFAVLFLLSGAAGLIYEIVWERLLELYFGVTMTAITLIVAAYMAGLGLGSLVGGRLARRSRSRLLVYGAVEIAIGAFGLASPALILGIGRISAGSPYPMVFLLSFVVLLIPTFLMGLTLPLLAQVFIDRVDTAGQIVGLLYGINTLGAAIGALLAGYVLIGMLGLDGAILVGVGLNLLVGAAAIIASRTRSGSKTATPPESGRRSDPVAWGYRTVIAAAFLVGFIGLGMEMVWIRILSLIDKHTAYLFPTVLGTFLLGLALGGYFWGRRIDRAPDPGRLVWMLEVGIGITASVCFLVLWQLIRLDAASALIGDFSFVQRPSPPIVAVDGGFAFSRKILLAGLWSYFLPVLLLVLPASLLMGGGLPMLDRIAITNPEIAGRRIGDVHVANILGSVAGSVAIPFAALPSLGTEWTLLLLAALTLVFPLFHVSTRWRARQHARFDRHAWAMVIVLLLLLGSYPSKGRFYTRLFEVGTDQTALIQESRETVVALTSVDGAPRSLWIGGEINGFYPADGTYEARALACAGASKPRRVLVVGLGGGTTAQFLAALPGVEQIVYVEILDNLARFLRSNLEQVEMALGDERVQYFLDDGRRFLYANPDEKFDLISIDPLRRYTAGHNNLYSREAMELYRDHLSPGGVLCAYADQRHILPATMAAIFPFVDQYRIRLVVSGTQALEYDLPYMEQASRAYIEASAGTLAPAASAALDPQRVLADFLRDQGQIRIDEATTRVLTDLDPYLEYYYLAEPVLKTVRFPTEMRQAFRQRIIGCDEACEQNITSLMNRDRSDE